MIKTLEIKGYRCFEDLKVDGLARLNLIVGKNNSGKTSLLEAIQLLTTDPATDAFRSILERRGEILDHAETASTSYDVSNLFFGRTLGHQSYFQVRGTAEKGPVKSLKAAIVERPADLTGLDREQFESELMLKLESSNKKRANIVAFQQNGGISFYYQVRLGVDRLRISPIYISNLSLPTNELRQLWEELSVQGQEARALEVLRLFDSDIENVNFFESQANGRGSIRLTSLQRYVPIGSLGDGASRILAMAVAAATTQNQVLLVDEIDTALHYSTISQVWEMLYKFAVNSGTQVFATTHSQDCVEAFAALARNGFAKSHDISLQRLMKNKSEAVSYTGDELAGAVSYDYEVR